MTTHDIQQLTDHKFYLENFTKIKTKAEGIIPFILNEAQKDLFNTLRKHYRVMILKARQLGFSTAVAGFFYVDTITRPGITTALIGYNSDMVAELLDKVHLFYKTTPKELRPTIHYDSRHQMSFPKMDSKILILANTKDVGRGYTINNCLVTELSSWDDAEEKMGGLTESVPPEGRLVIESTPRGQGNLYHRLWMTDNEYVKKEYGWWWGYTKEQMEWKKKGRDPRWFAQEYGLEFLASGRPVFEKEIIEKQLPNILKVGDMNGGHKVCKKEGWVIYKEPEVDGIYVVGSDVAEGVAGGSFSVAMIWDRKTGEEVAMYRGHISPDRFGDLLDRWGRRYNNALMTVEINNHGLTTVTILKQKIYPSLYFRPVKFEALSTTITDRIGWKTTKVTRPLLIDEFAQALREDNLIIHSKELLDEMSVFIYDDNGNMVPQEGFFDDTIFAAGIGFQGFKILYTGKLSQLDYEKHLPKNYAY